MLSASLVVRVSTALTRVNGEFGPGWSGVSGVFENAWPAGTRINTGLVRVVQEVRGFLHKSPAAGGGVVFTQQLLTIY